MGLSVITASVAEGSTVKRFIFSSAIHPLRVKMVNHQSKLQVEERLIESGLDYVILRPTHLMQNIHLANALKAGKLPVPYATGVNQLSPCD
jgi:uncharacterized protein YbjT (DUF2867 family)